MESCEAVEKELEKVLSKFSSTDRHSATSLQEVITHVEGVKRGLFEAMSGMSADEACQLTAAQLSLLEQCVKKIKDTVSKLSSEHKDLHGCVSKVGKAIDKNFVSDFEGVILQKPHSGSSDRQGVENGGAIGLSFGGDPRCNMRSNGGEEDDRRKRDIDEVICEHFLRHGMLDVAESLEKDCGRLLDEGKRDPFIQIHQVHEALKSRNLLPALQWVEANSEQLLSQNSSLEFRLHKLHFIELVQRGTCAQWEAIEYAKNFARFADAHTKELQVLMGSLLYIRQGLHNSPYAHLLDPIDWEEICDVFTRDACSLLGLSTESPLSIVIKAGCTALPPLLTIKQVMQQRQCSGVWSAKDELPVEIDLGPDCRFHSVFACPILRQQCSESNPPVRLVCGHVISRDALHKLSTVNKWAFLPNHTPTSSTNPAPPVHKVKCPYCPMEQSPSDAQQIYF